MDRRLLDYLPPVLREVAEMQAVSEANEPEISIAWDALTLVLANQFLETADARGVAVWEKELGLLPKNTDSLDERKARIKAKWNITLPYTFFWLRGWATGLFGPERHKETVEDYTLTIRLLYDFIADSAGQTAEVMDALRTTIPANIAICAINQYQPVLLHNPQSLWFAAMRILMGQQNRERLAIGQLRLAAVLRQRQVQGMGLLLGGRMENRERAVLHKLLMRVRVNSYGLYPIRLSGARRLDGTWLLGQSAAPPPKLHAVALSDMGVKNRQSAAASVTADTMWWLDGAFRLNGKKKLNAKIVRSEL